MADDQSIELAGELSREDSVDPLKTLRLRRGIVTAVSSTSATVTIGSTSIPNVPVYSHAVIAVGDNVDVLFDGPAPRIVGKLAASQGLPDTSTYTTASAVAAQALATNVWTRLTLAFEEGNSGNFSSTQNWYVIPNTGLYLVEGRTRVVDGSTAGINMGLSVDVTDGGVNDVWNSIPSTGAARRMVLENVRVARYTTGQQLRLSVYPDGGAVTVFRGRLSVVRLGV